jgi:hypothetical protein
VIKEPGQSNDPPPGTSAPSAGNESSAAAQFDHERFKNIFTGVQSLVFAVAIVIGGFWTLVTFNMLGQRDKARVELAELQDRAKREAEMVGSQAAIEIDIDATQISSADDQDRQFMLVSVVIKNTGTRNNYLEFDSRGPLAVTPVSFDADDYPVFGETERMQVVGGEVTERIAGIMVRAGSRSSRMPFLIPVKAPGIYYLAFSLDVKGVEADVVAKTAEVGRLTWSASTYFVVKKTPKQPLGSTLPPAPSATMQVPSQP